MNKSQFKLAITAFLLLGSSQLFSQNIAINTSGAVSPNSSAILDLSDASNNKMGILIPNVVLTNIALASPIVTPVDGLIVYNTSPSLLNGLYGTGYYYWSVSAGKWLFITTNASGPVGNGTTNYHARWTSPTALGIGIIQDNGVEVGIQTSAYAFTAGNPLLQVTANATNVNAILGTTPNAGYGVGGYNSYATSGTAWAPHTSFSGVVGQSASGSTSYQAGVFGYQLGTGHNSGGVLGATAANSNVWGGLGYTDVNGYNVPGYFNSNGDLPYIILNTSSVSNNRVRLQFAYRGAISWELATDATVGGLDNLYFYDRLTSAFGPNIASNGNMALGGYLVPLNKLDVNGAVAIGSYAGANTAPAGTSLIVSGQTGIGTATPNADAAVDIESTTKGFLLPQMNTASVNAIPATVPDGLMVYNNQTHCLMIYTNGAWKSIYCSCTPTITGGGTVTSAGGITRVTFTSSGTFTSPCNLNAIVFVVGGGGGGGGYISGGGGGGGAVYGIYPVASNQAITVTVGGGGAAGTGASAGSNGGNSAFGTMTAYGGGGGGGGEGANGLSGGCGGGRAGRGSVPGAGNTPATSPPQGYSGGLGSNGSCTDGLGAGAGGGGSGAVGGNGAGCVAGTGGAGISNSITGAPVNYAGGGGGGAYNGTGGGGGIGGGGAGANGTGGFAVAGAANTGGGGGAGGFPTNNNGAAGGSGVVIIEFPTP